jgi:hypothetical protein
VSMPEPIDIVSDDLYPHPECCDDPACAECGGAMTFESWQTDAEFLSWLADRLVKVYGESPNVDFVLRLRAIAAAQTGSHR